MFTVISLITMRTVYDKIVAVTHEKLKGNVAMGSAMVNQKYPGEWSIKDNQLFKGPTLMNGNFEIVDSIGMLTSDTVTIFQGDTRVATNVKDSSGARAVGTKASAIVTEATLMNGKTYIGRAQVVGKWTNTAYEPIRDSQNKKIIGMFYVGVGVVILIWLNGISPLSWASPSI